MTNENEQPAAIFFDVRAGIAGTDRDQWGTLATFTNGKDASAYQATIRQQYAEQGKALAIVRREATDEPKADWRERERTRLKDGTYKPLDAAVSFQQSLNELRYNSEAHDLAVTLSGMTVQAIFDRYAPDAFAHRSDSDASKIAYIASEANGLADRQTRVNAATAVDRLLSEAIPSDLMRNEILAAIVGAATPLFVTKDADEMQEAYVRCDGRMGVHSCMSHAASSYNSPIHPVRVYAEGGDLALAYMTNDNTPDGPIVARALVWPDRKVWGRIYANIPQVTFTNVLRANGYTTGHYDALSGARLAKIATVEDCVYVMPYIDGDQSFSDYAPDPERYFELGGGQYSACRTDGLASLDELAMCGRCDERYNENTGSIVDGEPVCERCAEDSQYCDDCDERTFGDCHTVQVPRRGWTTERTVCEGCLDGNYTEHDGEFYDPSLIADCDQCGDTHRTDELDGLGHCETCAEQNEDADQSENATAPTTPERLPLSWTAPLYWEGTGEPATVLTDGQELVIVSCSAGYEHGGIEGRAWCVTKSSGTAHGTFNAATLQNYRLTNCPPELEGELTWSDGTTGHYIGTWQPRGTPWAWHMVTRAGRGRQYSHPSFHRPDAPQDYPHTVDFVRSDNGMSGCGDRPIIGYSGDRAFQPATDTTDTLAA